MSNLRCLIGAIVCGLIGLTNIVAAETVPCQIYAVEDTSAGGQRRERVFVAISGHTPELATALGYTVASSEVMSKGLDYVDVFVTRRSDGIDRDDHSSATSLAWVRFNPGRTPVISVVLEAKVVASEVSDPGELAVLLTPKQDLLGVEVMDVYLTAKEVGVSFSCAE